MDPETPTEYEGETAIDSIGESTEAQVPQQPSSPPQQPEPKTAPEAPKQPTPPQPDNDDDGDIPKPAPKPELKSTAPPKREKGESLAEFRKRYEETKTQLTSKETEIATLKAQIAEARRNGEETVRKQLSEELEQVKKERAEDQRRLMLVDYKESNEYKSRFVEPLKATWKEVDEHIAGVKITMPDGSEVDAKREHISTLLQLPFAQAATKAHEWFGPAMANAIMADRNALVKIYKESSAAVKEFTEKGQQWRQKQAEESEQRSTRVVQEYETARQEIIKKSPQLFTPNEKDAEELGYHNKGSKLVDAAFKGIGFEDMDDERRSVALAKAQAAVASRAASFGVVVHRLLKSESRVAELEAKLKEFEESEPGAGSTTADTSKTASDNPEDAIDSIKGI